MQAFLDTEFVDTPAGPLFLSFGLCLLDGRELYVEREEPAVAEMTATYSSNFLQQHVLNQFGRMPGAQASLDEMAQRLKVWVDALGCTELEVVYDYNADFLLIEQLVGRLVQPPITRLMPVHVAYLIEDPAGIRAAEESWSAIEASRGFRRHHALADCLALAARFQAVHGDE